MNKTAVDILLREIEAETRMNQERRDYIAKMAIQLEELRSSLGLKERALGSLKDAVIALGGQVP